MPEKESSEAATTPVFRTKEDLVLPVADERRLKHRHLSPRNARNEAPAAISFVRAIAFGCSKCPSLGGSRCRSPPASPVRHGPGSEDPCPWLTTHLAACPYGGWVKIEREVWLRANHGTMRDFISLGPVHSLLYSLAVFHGACHKELFKTVYTDVIGDGRTADNNTVWLLPPLHDCSREESRGAVGLSSLLCELVKYAADWPEVDDGTGFAPRLCRKFNLDSYYLRGAGLPVVAFLRRLDKKGWYTYAGIIGPRDIRIFLALTDKEALLLHVGRLGMFDRHRLKSRPEVVGDSESESIREYRFLLNARVG